MDLAIKNDKLIGHFTVEQGLLAKRSGESIDSVSVAWVIEHPESILFGYLDSFLEVCETSKIKFDLTYDTIKNVGIGLAALYNTHKNIYNPEENAEIIAKTLATVLSYLVINEHDCWFRCTSYLEQIKAGKAPNQALWADVFEIAVGRKTKFKDLCDAAMACVRIGSVMSPNGLILAMDPIVEEYEKLTGVDLVKHGIINVVMN